MNVQDCSWCVSPFRDAAEAAIVAGEPKMTVARRFGLGRSQMYKHLRHVRILPPKGGPLVTNPEPVQRLAAVRAEIVDSTDGWATVIPRLESLLLEVRRVRERWEDTKPQVAVSALRLEREILNDVAKLRGEIPDTRTVKVAEIAEWSIVLDALENHPKALRAVSKALGNGNR
jgi:hypothetical protein